MPSNRDNQQTSKQLPRLPGVDDLAIIPARKPAMAATAVTGSGDALIVPTEDAGVDEPWRLSKLRSRNFELYAHLCYDLRGLWVTISKW